MAGARNGPGVPGRLPPDATGSARLSRCAVSTGAAPVRPGREIRGLRPSAKITVIGVCAGEAGLLGACSGYSDTLRDGMSISPTLVRQDDDGCLACPSHYGHSTM